MTKKRKLKHTSLGLAGPDDPIFKEGPTFYTRPSDRGSTPSTPSSAKTPDKASGPGSADQKAPTAGSKPISAKEA